MFSCVYVSQIIEWSLLCQNEQRRCIWGVCLVVWSHDFSRGSFFSCGFEERQSGFTAICLFWINFTMKTIHLASFMKPVRNSLPAVRNQDKVDKKSQEKRKDVFKLLVTNMNVLLQPSSFLALILVQGYFDPKDVFLLKWLDDLSVVLVFPQIHETLRTLSPPAVSSSLLW